MKKAYTQHSDDSLTGLYVATVIALKRVYPVPFFHQWYLLIC